MSNMEPIYAGRAIFESYNGVGTITIPPPSSRLLKVLLVLFLLSWVGGFFALVSTSLSTQNKQDDYFYIAWIVGSLVGGFFLLRAFIWTFFGKEIITIKNGTLTIEKKNALLVNTKTCDLNEIENVRAVELNYGNTGPFDINFQEVALLNNMGAIHFELGSKTIRFGMGLDEIEGDYLIQELKNKGYLKESNFM